MITPYSRIIVNCKSIVDYRQFNINQFQYKCYMDIENNLIASIEVNREDASIRSKYR